MNKNLYLGHLFLFLLLALVLWGSYVIFKPFLVALFLAFVLYTLFRKIYLNLNKKLGGRKSLSSLLMCILIIFIVILPIFGTLGLAISETTSLIQSFQNKETGLSLEPIKTLPIIENFNFIPSEIDYKSLLNNPQITDNAKNVGGVIIGIAKSAYDSTSSFIFMLVVMFFSLYYFFKDGEALLKKMMKVSPLSTKQEKKLLERFEAISKATIKGTLIIAVIQGALMGLTFWAVGVSAPVFWAIITVIISIIPLLGAVLVWLPIGLVMLLLGNIWQAIVIFAIGGIIVSSVDNFLRPKLVEGQTSLHPLLVFLSTLGGLAVFGPMGFIIGPVIISLLLALLEIYQEQFKQELKSCNNAQ
ncbi:MAG: AI-2E family transporter [Candidatus Moraniibacteriota bacterium]